MNTDTQNVSPNNGKRKKGLYILTGLFCLIAIIYGIYWYIYNSRHETTDNAYVQGNIVQITSQIAGTVSAINAQDTNFVREGQSLVKLDDTDTRIALDQARAQLAQTVREVRTLYANNATLDANVKLREADVVRAKNALIQAKEDLVRRQSIMAIGAVSTEEVQHAQTSLITAQSAETAANASVLSAKEQLNSNKALTDGVEIEQHPNVLRASANFREAYINMQRSELLSPVTGYVTRRSVQLGQRIQAGTPLMAVIPLNQLWVDANFKEVQLDKIRIGQSATLVSDVYGKKVTYHGTVEGLGAGTGAAFALLPAQNATGNWIKVVQRVPVRIKLDAKELRDNPLRIGLSMEVDVEISNQSGQALAKAPNKEKSVDAIDSYRADMEAEIKKIIAGNLAK